MLTLRWHIVVSEFFEMAFFMARMVVRSLPSHHESVSASMMGFAMTFKKCVGRYVCYLIISPAYAVAASVLLGIWEVLTVATVAVNCSGSHEAF